MANLQSSGAISLLDIKNLFGGPASPSFANYYRGGSYIPSSKTVSSIVYEPSGSAGVNGVAGVQAEGYWYIGNIYKGVWFNNTSGGSVSSLWWNGTNLGVYPGVSSVTIGGYTYYRTTTANFGSNYSTSCYCYTYYAYYVRRTSGSSSTVNINTGVPSSGQISMNQFYGAEKP